MEVIRSEILIQRQKDGLRGLKSPFDRVQRCCLTVLRGHIND